MNKVKGFVAPRFQVSSHLSGEPKWRFGLTNSGRLQGGACFKGNRDMKTILIATLAVASLSATSAFAVSDTTKGAAAGAVGGAVVGGPVGAVVGGVGGAVVGHHYGRHHHYHHYRHHR